MKSLKDPLLLFSVWIISIFSLCFSFVLFSKGSPSFDKIVGGTLLLMVYSAVFSLPAFLFFFVVSIFTLRSQKLKSTQKTLIMLGANLTDIIITFVAVYLLFGNHSTAHDAARTLRDMDNILTFYPLWVLVGISSLFIIIFPFNFKKTI